MHEMEAGATEEQLISENMGLVVSLARSFRPRNQNQLEEYVQSGRIGLWKAVLKYDPSKGALSTIAWHYIKWEIIKNLPNSKKKKNKNLHTVSFADLSYTPAITPQETSVSLSEIRPTTFTDTENTIFDMRAAGYTMKEVGEYFGKSRTWANTASKKMIKKIQESIANE